VRRVIAEIARSVWRPVMGCWSLRPSRVTMSSTPVLGLTQSPVKEVHAEVSSGIKRSECGPHHSLPISAEVKKTWLYKFSYDLI
jgi:hypothetical protein